MISNAISYILRTQIVPRLGTGLLVAAGFEVAGPFIAAVGAVLIYDKLLSRPTNDFIDRLFHTEDTEFVLRSSSGEIMGGAFYLNGSSENPFSNADTLVRMALANSDLPDPEPNCYIEYLFQRETQARFEIRAADLLKVIGESVGNSEAEAATWGWAVTGEGQPTSNHFVVRRIDGSDLSLVDAKAQLAVKVYDEKGSIKDLTLPIGQIGTNGFEPVVGNPVILLLFAPREVRRWLCSAVA